MPLAQAQPTIPVPPSAELGRLYAEHAPRVLAAARRVTGSLADAEDVVQTVFLRLARREEALDLSAGAASYFHRAGVRGGLDLLRARRGKLALAEVGEEPMARESADEQAERRDLARVLRAALGELSPSLAEVFSLRHLEELENREIAQVTGRSQAVVAVQLHRARRQLRRALAAWAAGR